MTIARDLTVSLDSGATLRVTPGWMPLPPPFVSKTLLEGSARYVSAHDTTMATVEQVRAFAKGGSARIQR